MNLVDDVEDVKHVEDNAPRLLVLQNDSEQPIEILSLLQHKLLDVTVSLDVFLKSLRMALSPQLVRTLIM